MSKNFGTTAVDLHLEGAGFESRLVHRFSRLRVFVFFLSPFRLTAECLSECSDDAVKLSELLRSLDFVHRPVF
jgi:hypothetical protein